MDDSFCDTIAAGFSESIRLMLFGSTEQTVCLSLLHMHTHSNVWFLEVQTMNYQMIMVKGHSQTSLCDIAQIITFCINNLVSSNFCYQ